MAGSPLGRTVLRRTRYALAIMCRSIKVLRHLDQPATQEEIEAAALQFVRKVSGYRQPSTKNAEAFEAAVAEIALASRRLLDAITATHPAHAHAHAHER
jgi:hypothetical protein